MIAAATMSLLPGGSIRRPVHRFSAEQEPTPTPEQQQPTEQAQSNPPRVNAVEDPEIARGQRTAIITGAISIIFGVAYLALVQVMDMRGGELLPPPPEAYIP